MPTKKTSPIKAKTKKIASTTVKTALNKIMTEALAKKASSIHLEKHETEVKLRYRINDELKKSGKFTADSFDKLSEYLKSLANVPKDVATPQEGRFKIKSGQEQINVNAAFWPTYRGEKIILKLLDDKNADLKTLSLAENDLANLEKTLGAKSGLILLTEMRLANKNRLLYALLNKLDKELLDIFTLEDFIEYPLLGVHQQQLDKFTDEQVSDTLAKLLRHEPDVVMISKISGPKSAKQIINAAAHNIVLTYLPASSLEESMNFLKNWGIDDYVLESVLKHIITHQDNKYKII